MIAKLRNGSHKLAGRDDNGGRWRPYEPYEVPGSFDVRPPSRRWNLSYFKHFYTLKYAQLLAKHRPDLYCMLQGIDLESEEAKLLLAQAALRRLAS